MASSTDIHWRVSFCGGSPGPRRAGASESGRTQLCLEGNAKKYVCPGRMYTQCLEDTVYPNVRYSAALARARWVHACADKRVRSQ